LSIKNSLSRGQADFWDAEGAKLKADLAKMEAELEDKDADLRR